MNLIRDSITGQNRAGKIFLAGVFVLLWSSGFIGASYGLGYAGTFTLLFWRYLLLVVVLILLTTIFRAWRRMDLREIWRHAIIGVLAHAVWLIAVLGALDFGVSAGITAFITALQPMVTAALAARFISERVTALQWLGIMLGLVSVGIVVADKVAVGGNLIAHLLPLAAVLAISAATVFDRHTRMLNPDSTPPPVLLTTLIHAAASLVVLAPLAWWLEGFAAQLGAPLIFAVVWLALVVSLGAYGLMFVLLRCIEATRVSALVYLSPPVTIVVGYFVFGDGVSAADLAGLGVAGAAVILVTYSPSPVAAQKPPPCDT